MAHITSNGGLGHDSWPLLVGFLCSLERSSRVFPTSGTCRKAVAISMQREVVRVPSKLSQAWL
jgi:hypothetical protein